MIDDEISNNKKTDEKQSEDISQLEEAIASGGGGSSSEVEENFNEFTGTTYPADKEALENKDAELEAVIAEKADAADVEAVQAAIETLNGDGDGSVKKTAEDAAAAEVAKVVAEAPEDLDTLKEVADYIAADKTKASEIETKLSEHDAAVEELGAKDEELAAKDAELEAAIAEKADASALEDEITRAKTAEQALDTKVDAKADNDALEAEITRALGKEGELQDAIAEKASNDSLTEEKERAEAAEQALDAKVDTKADASTVADELTELKSKDTELEAKDVAQDEEIAKKVEWTESTPGRNHIVLKNHDSLLGTATDGTTYNVAMVSKWDVADFGTTHLHLNLNTSDAVTINDNKVVATEDVVDEKIAAIDGFAKPEDLEPKADSSAVTEEISAAIAPLAVKSEVTEEINAVSDALAQFETQVADEYQLKGNYLTEDALDGLAKESAVTEEIAAAVAAVEATVATKADATAVEALEATVATKADADTVYTKEEVDAMLADKQAEIDTMKAEYAKLKDIVGDLGGAVEYSVPEDGTFNNMMKKSGIITLKEDVTTGTYTGGITSKNITTLKLGGKTLTFSGTTTNNPAIMARGTQQITITGGGTLDAAGRIAIEANGADTVINLGGTMFGRPTYVTDRSGGELIYCYLGTINITEGIFKNNGADKSFMLNCYDANYQNGTAKIVVTGGKFYDFDPANNTAEGPGTSYVPDGYESVASTETIDGVEHTVYTVKKVS